MSSDQVEILRSAYEEYSKTYSKQLDTQRHLNDKAAEITKIDLLVGGIAASIVTVQPENIAIPYFVVGSITLLASIWFSSLVYSQTKIYDIGIGEKAFGKMSSIEDLEKHYRNLSREYSGMVGDFDQPYKQETENFETALWFGIATIFLFILGAGSTVVSTIFYKPYPPTIDFIVMFCTAILLMYGKHRDKYV